MSTIHFYLTDKYLAVANTGQPFTPEGLDAICYMHQSSKGSIPFSSPKDAQEKIEELRQECFQDFKNNKLLKQEIGAQENVRDDYRGRILIELIQNADDAAMDRDNPEEYIGYKGIGFKAILNISKSPRIHSGYLHCKFSPNLFLNDFKHRIEEGAEVPVLRLPFPASVEEEDSKVNELIKLYDTVIILPFTTDNTFHLFLREWEKTVSDPRVLLFLHNAEKVLWERQGTNKTVWYSNRDGSRVRFETNPEMEELPTLWEIFKRGRSALAVPLDTEIKLQPVNDYPNIRVYFPTDDLNPFPFMVHVCLSLDQGRKHVHFDGDDEEVKGALQNVAELVCKLLSSVPEAGLWLDFLRPRTDPDDMRGLERLLWEVVVEKVRQLPIPETDGLTLESVRLCPDEDIHWTWLAWRGGRFELWSRFKGLIAKHRSDNLNSLPFLPPGVDNEDREQTILSINPDARLSREKLQELPLIPVEGFAEPVAPARTALFLPPDKVIPIPPMEIHLNFLSKSFIESVRAQSEADALENFLIETLGVEKFEPLKVVERAVLPVLKEGNQPGELLKFLRDLVEPTLKKEDLTFDWKSPVRKELAKHCHIPVRGGGTRPAIEVYAGDDWTGDKLLEHIYGNRQDRSFLEPPPKDEKERERREKLYRWLGVGWCPKVLDVELHPAEPKQYKGPKWEGDTFPVENPPPLWDDHCRRDLRPDDQNEIRKARLRQDWMLDGDESALRSSGAFRCIADNWSYYNKYKEAVYFRSNNRKLDNDDVGKSGDSYLAYLLKNIPWIPAKSAKTLQKASEVFVPGEVLNVLGGLVYEVDAELQEEFRSSIGIRKDKEDLTDEDWHRWLGRATSWDPSAKKKDRDAIDKLYRVALNHWQAPKLSLKPWKGPVWAVESLPDGQKLWELIEGRDEVLFLDRSDFLNLRLKGLRVFPITLGRFEGKAEKLFQLQRLSKHLIGIPEPKDENDLLSTVLLQQRNNRLLYLQAYLDKLYEDDEKKLSEKIELIQSLKIRVKRELNVQFLMSQRHLDSPQAMEAFYDASEKTLWLKSELFLDNGKPSNRAWEWLAKSLVYCADLSLDQIDTIKNLLTYSDQDLEGKLLDLGLTKPDIEEVRQKSIRQIRDEEEPKVLEDIPRPDTPETPVERTQGVLAKEGLGLPREVGIPTTEGPPYSPPSGHPGRDQARREKGLEAEAWIRKEIKGRLVPEGWEISERSERDLEDRESDIVIRHTVFGEFHIEAKHAKAGSIYWSEKQVAKAGDLVGRYFMVILEPEGDGYKEHWLGNPLKDLLSFNRDGTWVWYQDRRDGVPLITPAWEMPGERPSLTKNPSIFYFHIRIERNKLQQIAHDFSEIRNKLELGS